MLVISNDDLPALSSATCRQRAIKIVIQKENKNEKT